MDDTQKRRKKKSDKIGMEGEGRADRVGRSDECVYGKKEEQRQGKVKSRVG